MPSTTQAVVGLLRRIGSDPLGFVQRVTFKLLVGPLRYWRRSGYDAERYWRDRFKRYGTGLQGSGHEGLSERENAAMYADAAKTFLRICVQEGISLSDATVLDIGCGPGFYTALCQLQGVRGYTGVDVTDVLFPTLRAQFPSYKFLQSDITTDGVAGRYNLILLIDVLEHITTPEKLDGAMAHVCACLATGGTIAAALPTAEGGKRRSLFYLKFWTQTDLESRLPQLALIKTVPFRDGVLCLFRERR